jgi:hypothetical protein
MGTMPFHLEKGVLGLRLDYLTRSPAVRAHVLQRLEAQEDPFVVVTDINIPGVGTINVFTNTRSDFATKLDALLQVDPTPADPYNRRSGRDYIGDHGHLNRANNDNTGNRGRFAEYWLDPDRRQRVTSQLSQVLRSALDSTKHHVDYWWECSLEHGEGPDVMMFETPGAAHVLFLTDHQPVMPMSLDAERAPLDEDPIYTN